MHSRQGKKSVSFVPHVLTEYIRVYSWGQHIHYDLEFCGLKVSESYRLACRNKLTYCNFGAVAVALELIPGLNLLFMWTNIVGAALWIGDDYEKGKHQHNGRTEDSERSRLLKDEEVDPESYSSCGSRS